MADDDKSGPTEDQRKALKGLVQTVALICRVQAALLQAEEHGEDSTLALLGGMMGCGNNGG